MMFNGRKATVLAVLLAILTTSGLAFALKVPPPKEYTHRRDPNTDGGKRVGEGPGFTGYPADPNEIKGQLYQAPDEEYSKYSKSWTGANWGLGVEGGVGWLYGGAFDSHKPALVYGAFAQITTLLNVVDAIVSFNHGNFDNAIGGVPVDVSQWNVNLSVGIHPMFFSGLSRDWFSMFLSSIYLLGGTNLSIQSTDGEGIDSRFVRPGFHLGAGFGSYLTNPDRGWSLWLGVQYRWTNMVGGREDDIFRYTWSRQHQIFMRLSIRFNGNVGNTVPAPQSHPLNYPDPHRQD